MRSSLSSLSYSDLITLSLSLAASEKDSWAKVQSAPSVAFPSEAKRAEYVKSWTDAAYTARKLFDRVERALRRMHGNHFNH